MNQKDFFKQLRDELQDHPFRDRFLEELEDHVQDLENDNELKEKFIESEMIKKYLGEPKEVKESFLNIMNPFRKLFFVLEGLFYGLLMIPTALMYLTFMRWIVTEAPITLSRAIFAIAAVIFLKSIIHFFALKRFSGIKNDISHARTKWFSLVLLPSILILFALVFFKNYDQYSYIALSEKIIGFVGYLGISGFGIFLAFRFKANKQTKAKKIKKKIIVNFLKKALILYIGAGIIFKTIFTYVDQSIYDGPLILISIIFSIFSPIFWLEYLFVFFWAAIGNSLFPNPNLFAGFYSLMIFLLFLAVQSLWVIIMERKYNSFRSLIVLYVISLFFINTNSFSQEPDFKVPAVNISKSIEKNQLGIFYPVLKYFNHDEGTFFRYEVGFKDSDLGSGFVIKSNTDNYTYIPYKTLEMGNPELLYETNMESVTGINLPHYYECDRKDLENCNINDFVARYVSSNGGLVMDAAFSKDGKWGVIVMMDWGYDPDNVYLVNLNGLHEK